MKQKSDTYKLIFVIIRKQLLPIGDVVSVDTLDVASVDRFRLKKFV